MEGTDSSVSFKLRSTYNSFNLYDANATSGRVKTVLKLRFNFNLMNDSWFS